MRVIEREACPSIKALGGHKDKFFLSESLGDTAAYVDAHGDLRTKTRVDHQSGFMGKDSWREVCRKLNEGDNAYVAASDKLMSGFEDTHHPTAAWRTVDDVAGAVPNVGAYLAGSPMSMRRRKRSASDTAPLAIVAELSCSSIYTAEDIERRGAAILALVRVLSSSRPVTLWVGAGFDTGIDQRSSFWTMTRIDTSPLDLARAAYAISSPAINRCMTFALGYSKMVGSRGRWCYSGAIDNWGYRRHGKEIFAGVIPEADDVLYVPPMVLGDDAPGKQPAKWLSAMIKQYGNGEEE